MTQEDYRHPIAPPPELVQQWLKEFYGAKLQYVAEASINLAARAAQWGADQELEACLEWVCCETTAFAADLKAARRPKPPSLKKQALADFDWMVGRTLGRPEFDERSERIRRALEQLPDAH
jgi:hypothetical protein